MNQYNIYNILKIYNIHKSTIYIISMSNNAKFEIFWIRLPSFSSKSIKQSKSKFLFKYNQKNKLNHFMLIHMFRLLQTKKLINYTYRT